MGIITVPFGYLLDFLYNITHNYGVALILFTILVQLVLLPVTAKSKKSMMKMTRMQPRINAIKEKYANDQQKQQEALQQLQKEEGASLGCGGCLWSFVPLLILIPLYQVIRERIATAGASGANFIFLGIDLAVMPQLNVFTSAAGWTWANIGAVLVPVISAGSQVLQTLISRRANDSLVTNEKGVQDKEAASKSQAAQTSNIMMWTMPIFSLLIGFSVPVALSLYWFVGGVIRTVEDVILTKKYRKIYDAEDAERLKKAMELEAIEAEKERIRAEKRAANPDGISENTSKKKLQKQQQQAEEAAKAAAKKEYDAKKGVVEEEVAEKQTLSGISDRPYCKGRAYDPNRYTNTEEE